MSSKCIVLAGPTAVGKTSLSLRLAKEFNMEIINCDATQVYKKLDIASAKIKEEEKKGIKHHLIDIVEPDYEYSVSDYYKDANKILNDNKDKAFIITGGTGLYIQSITDGLSDTNKKDEAYRKYLEGLSKEELIEILDKKNIKKDKLDLNNKVRLIRKIEIGNHEYNNIIGNDREFLKVFLVRDRENLYDRINKRVDIMIETGLIEEAKNIYAEFGENIKAIGYKELNEYFKNNLSLDEAIELIKRNSRRYAKRQFTWFKNKGYLTLDVSKYTEDEIVELIRREYGN
ncbi:tRNA delta(2)-isopentenylpyrophosphate transferase [Oceanivirga miroungae]|uniref:tRNA dimethylallyltransferase n=2 Tax=Oceanivirga miroungae TaxID=1130046 RepID=A0A6I8MAE7_9FUSO|nr:tRNA delta(2)-isopentenylpyrophosphate transferase [Oceanivirga miroungae]